MTGPSTTAQYGALYMPLALSCPRFTHVAAQTKLRQLRLDTIAGPWASTGLQNIYWSPVTYYFSATLVDLPPRGNPDGL